MPQASDSSVNDLDVDPRAYLLLPTRLNFTSVLVNLIKLEHTLASAGLGYKIKLKEVFLWKIPW